MVEMSGNMGTAGTWCILRTSGGRTVPLSKSLADAGFEVWTPVRTIRRPAPGQARRLVLGQTRKLIDVELPILPGFVFARSGQLDDLVRASVAEPKRHPSFSIFHRAGRVPLVRDASIMGLRMAEEGAASEHAEQLATEAREAERLARAEQLRTAKEKRKALRKEVKDLPTGAEVTVSDMPAFDGLVGRILEGRGASALVDFGGMFPVEIEAWQLVPTLIQNGNSLPGLAA
ncbi:hypothetical protein [Sphingomonas sp. ABOLE]|uniref:hypothetical protein n=1 Tax=Sphingomonas sp. ABOLE TaxID=1985878 RepID=UPI000F7E66CA|nr:hypothetical protein [Sphingomonas sp. ABOLE]